MDVDEAQTKIGPIALLDTSACALIRDICVHAIVTDPRADPEDLSEGVQLNSENVFLS